MTCKLQENVPKEKYLTYDQMNIIIASQKLWIKFSNWFRVYIRAKIYETQNLQAVTNYLDNIPSTFYPMFSTFLGPEVAQNLVNLLSEFIQSSMGVVEAMKYGDNELTSSRIINVYQIADKLASYLARINIYWAENQWKYLLYQFIKLRVDLINAIINNQLDVGFELEDRLDDIVILMSNYMARGIIASQQTPNL